MLLYGQQWVPTSTSGYPRKQPHLEDKGRINMTHNMYCKTGIFLGGIFFFFFFVVKYNLQNKAPKNMRAYRCEVNVHCCSSTTCWCCSIFPGAFHQGG